MRPNHHQFLAFAYVVREGSFSAAANRLGVTQSTITQHIAKLEKTVGSLLMLRSRDGVQLTAAGQEFYDLADRMIALEAEMSERLDGFNAMKDGRLNVIGNAPQPALRIIARFQKRFPDIQINFALHDWTMATKMIRNRVADVGLITDAPEDDIWERIYIESAEYVLFCRSDHPLSKRKTVSLRDLQNDILITPETGSLTRRVLDDTCNKHGVQLLRVATMSNFPLMYEAVLQGMGVAIFLRNSSLVKNDVTEIPIRELTRRHQTFLVATKDRARLKLVSEFIGAAG